MSSISPRSDVNRSAILSRIGAHGPASRADLARALGISPALVTRLTRELIADGLLVELEHSPSRGGRPAQRLGLATRSGGAIGIKIAPDHLTLVEVSIDGRVVRTHTDPFDASAPVAVGRLADAAAAFIAGAEHSALVGIGVGLPGNVLDQSEGIVDSTQLGWSQAPVGSALRAATNLPVLIDNNVNALALAESLFGAGRGHADFLVVTIGTGIGAGIVASDAIIRGHSGNAGEIGHIPVVEDGPECQCGAHGCLEAIIGEQALVAQAVSEGTIPAGAGIGALQEAADDGDAAALALFSAAGRHLGRVVAGLTNTLDPELIVILGEGAKAWEHWSQSFEPALRSGVIPRKRGVGVVVERWQDDRWAQGAAALVLSTPFDAEGISGDQGQLVRERLISSLAGERT